MPLSPQIDEDQIKETRQGLLPLGIHAVFPPLYEDRKNGVRVARVMQESSTTRAGLRPGDLITDINDTKLISADHLIGLLTLVEPDQTYTFKVVRTELDASGKPIKKTLQLNVTGLTPLPPEEQVW